MIHSDNAALNKEFLFHIVTKNIVSMSGVWHKNNRKKRNCQECCDHIDYMELIFLLHFLLSKIMLIFFPYFLEQEGV